MRCPIPENQYFIDFPLRNLVEENYEFILRKIKNYTRRTRYEIQEQAKAMDGDKSQNSDCLWEGVGVD